MTNLEKLYISSSDISDIGIKNLNLRELRAGYCAKIMDINHMSKLEKLDVMYGSIGDEGIKKLNLTEFCACWNSNITDVNHMTKLKKNKCKRELLWY